MPPVAPTFLPREVRGVLVADDEPLIRSLFQGILSRRGLTVWPAADGREAVEVFRRERGRISMAFLDMRMPVLDGAAALGELLRLDPSLACCMISADFHEREPEELCRRGAVAVLPKPFAVTQIDAMLDRLAAAKMTG
jgi:CheY-like chemotaxis protein